MAQIHRMTAVCKGLTDTQWVWDTRNDLNHLRIGLTIAAYSALQDYFSLSEYMVDIMTLADNTPPGHTSEADVGGMTVRCVNMGGVCYCGRI